MFAECFFKARVWEREDRRKYDWASVPKAKEALSLFMECVAEIVIWPKERPCPPGTSVDVYENPRSRNPPPCAECTVHCVKHPVGLELTDNVEMAGGDGYIGEFGSVNVSSEGYRGGFRYFAIDHGGIFIDGGSGAEATG